MPAFKLSKWYMDCVTDSGDASIGYIGVADWGLIHLHYSSLLESTAGQIRQQYSLRERGEPQIKEATIGWKAGAFGIDAVWHSDSAGLRETIFESDQGSVEWHCLMPCARVQMQHRSGLGYVEHLTMTIAPWKIPIRHLRWGRFTSASDWAVWIDWEGDFSRRMVYLNGKPVTTSLVEDGQLKFDNGDLLTTSDSIVLRDGPLGTTALSAIPGVEKTLPARLLSVSERKWRSRARLTCADSRTVEGWAIHERVSWPR